MSRKARERNLSNANSAPADVEVVCDCPGLKECLGTLCLSSGSHCQSLCVTGAEGSPCLVWMILFDSMSLNGDGTRLAREVDGKGSL